jgi:hypothetical protein
MLWVNTYNIQTDAVRDAKFKKKKVSYLKFTEMVPTHKYGMSKKYDVKICNLNGIETLSSMKFL